MAKAIMIQGTASNAGKSVLVAGLCRIFKQDGYTVAPFKSQNMALNSFITADGLEMGRAQVMQAEAAKILPDVRMNPVLLKPTNERASQVILNGKVLGNMDAKNYFTYKQALVPKVREAYESLAAEYDIIVIEGAGSPAEINLKSGDMVNMGMAKLAKSPVLIVGDIDRGGVFAALTGTMLLLEEDERAMVKGTVINKFRGDLAILEPGLKQLEEIIHVPVLGVVPYLNVSLDDEDSLTERFGKAGKPAAIDIAVIRLPRISNFTDFNAFECMENTSLRYVGRVSELGRPDLILIPGTKNTMADLLWLRQSGLEAAVLNYAAQGLPIFGICGGFQMLGKTLKDPMQVEHGGELRGLGLLDMQTVFKAEKYTTQVEGVCATVDGIFKELSAQPFAGYEIHAGESSCAGNLVQSGNTYGTYIHGFFDKANIAQTVVRALLQAKGLNAESVEAMDMQVYKEEQYDVLAAELRKALDMNAIYRILQEGV